VHHQPDQETLNLEPRPRVPWVVFYSSMGLKWTVVRRGCLQPKKPNICSIAHFDDPLGLFSSNLLSFTCGCAFFINFGFKPSACGSQSRWQFGIYMEPFFYLKVSPKTIHYILYKQYLIVFLKIIYHFSHR